MLIIGCDFHPSGQQVCVLEKETGEVVAEQWLKQRELRQLRLHRHKLVRMRAQVKNQLQHIALNQGQQKKGQLWTKAGRELLEKLALEAWTARRRNDLLQLLDTLNGYCEGLELAVK